jgi:hypothetical protein
MVGEVADRIPGADLDAAVTGPDGSPVGTGSARIAPGSLSAVVAITSDRALDPGSYLVRLRVRTPSSSEALSTTVSLPSASQSSGAIFFRRGPLTGNRDAPTADLRFRRTERIRVEIPAAATTASARLLDRTGKPVPVPVTAATREDPDGSRWATAELSLVPLASGDYVMELVKGTEASDRTLVAFRLVP